MINVRWAHLKTDDDMALNPGISLGRDGGDKLVADIFYAVYRRENGRLCIIISRRDWNIIAPAQGQYHITPRQRRHFGFRSSVRR